MGAVGAVQPLEVVAASEMLQRCGIEAGLRQTLVAPHAHVVGLALLLGARAIDAEQPRMVLAASLLLQCGCVDAGLRQTALARHACVAALLLLAVASAIAA